MSTDYDSTWKEALDVYFQAFLAFFFRWIHDDIDWSRGFESLDKELQKIAPKSAHGRRYVDKLVKVWRKNGREVWVLLHVEVQTQRQPRLWATDVRGAIHVVSTNSDGPMSAWPCSRTMIPSGSQNLTTTRCGAGRGA